MAIPQFPDSSLRYDWLQFNDYFRYDHCFHDRIVIATTTSSISQWGAK